MRWIFLAGAITAEVTATLSLKLAATRGTKWYAVVGLGYVAAFGLLTCALRGGLGIGAAYAIWAASGVAMAALAARLLFREPLTPTMLGGIAMVVAGVVLIENGHALTRP